jgi:hypothetical protein
MADITVPVPDDRVAAFLAHVGQWLAAPAGTTWTAAPPPAPGPPVAWDVSRQDEFAVATKVWGALSAGERKLLDALGRVDKIEAAELAKVLGLTGVFDVQQSVAVVNAACEAHGREPCVRVSEEAGGVYAALSPTARQALSRDP